MRPTRPAVAAGVALALALLASPAGAAAQVEVEPAQPPSPAPAFELQRAWEGLFGVGLLLGGVAATGTGAVLLDRAGPADDLGPGVALAVLGPLMAIGGGALLFDAILRVDGRSHVPERNHAFALVASVALSLAGVLADVAGGLYLADEDRGALGVGLASFASAGVSAITMLIALAVLGS